MACQREQAGKSAGAKETVVVPVGSAAGSAASSVAANVRTEPRPDGVLGMSDDEVLAEGIRYLDEPTFRRAVVEASLANPTNSYSRVRLTNYGLNNRGWDMLPVWIPKSIVLQTPVADRIRTAGVTEDLKPDKPIWDGVRPTSRKEWIALGREVFFRYPLRAEPLLHHAIKAPELAKAVGVIQSDEGPIAGGVVFEDIDGKAKLGITCALCHTNREGDSVTSNTLVVGRARRTFDYGRLRLDYHKVTKSFVDPDLARRMGTWGPGRADVTEDDSEDPVAIPDLFGLAGQMALTQAGTILHVGPTALAIRQETQLLHSNHQKVRPPRELSWALALFLYSLEPPAHSITTKAEDLSRGKLTFGKHCQSCHGNPVYSGKPVSVGLLGVDPHLADGTARGTGKYRPASLIGVGSAAPYLHHGAVPTLEDLFSADRLAPEYARSPLGKGPVLGHKYGVELGDEEKRVLIAYLRSL